VYRIVLHANDDGNLLARPRELMVSIGGPYAEPDTGLRLDIPIGGYTTTVDVPAGAITRTTTFSHTSFTTVPNLPAPEGFAFAGRGFDLDAFQMGELQTPFDLHPLQ
jgi:hypothetical protein